jgi:intracellular septation protein A/isopentenyldiphosphate isomerase
MNLSRLLKSLLPSLLPLLVYVAAEAFFGEAIGLIVGVGVGLVEFVVVFIRDRKPDPFVAVDTLLLVLAGAVSFISGNDLFFKLKPAVIELVFGASFALFLVLPPKYLASYLARQLKGIELPPTALPAMRKSLGALLAILGLHALLTVFAALRLSTAVWGFISGALLYILFGLLFLVQFVTARLAARRHRDRLGATKGEKLLPVVDEEGHVTGEAPERICHAGEGVLHPSLRLIVVNGQGEVFLRRAPGGAWDLALTRHVELGEGLEGAVSRGLSEALGLTPLVLEGAKTAPQAALRYRRDEEGESELVFLFFLAHEGPFSLDKGEEGRFFSADELGASASRGEMAPRFLKEYGLLVADARRSATDS